MIKLTNKSSLLVLICLLAALSLTFIGCTSDDNSNTMQQEKDVNDSSSEQKLDMTDEPMEQEKMLAEQDQQFAADYPATMEQCMFIDEATVQLKEDGKIFAEIIVKDDITKDFLTMRMEQHMNALIEQYSNGDVELVANYHDGVEAARAVGNKGEIISMEFYIE